MCWLLLAAINLINTTKISYYLHIESASNHSSHHSHSHSYYSPVQPLVQQQQNNIVTVNEQIKINVHSHTHTHAPQLANPLPPLITDIVIPMNQQNYNVLLQQMYPQYNSNTYNNNPYSRGNYQTPVQGIVLYNIYLCMFCTVLLKYAMHGLLILILIFIDDINDIYGNPLAAPFSMFNYSFIFINVAEICTLFFLYILD